jgi:hypothetical protein
MYVLFCGSFFVLRNSLGLCIFGVMTGFLHKSLITWRLGLDTFGVYTVFLSKSTQLMRLGLATFMSGLDFLLRHFWCYNFISV